MHKLSKVTIRNYKSCKETTVKFPNYAVMIGYNNAGKSNILEAINWFLNPSGLDVDCFNDSEKPIEIEGMIEGISGEILGRLDKKHKERIEKYVKGGKILFKRTQSEPGGKKSLRDLFLRNFDEKDESEDAWDDNPTGIDNAISNLFPEPIQIPAMDDATEDISKSKSTTTIGKLIAEILKPIEEKREDEINKVLGGLRDRFEADGEKRADELEEFDQEANQMIGDFFPGVEINVHIPTPEIKELFKSGTVKIKEDGVNVLRDFDSLGHGAQRSIQMALIRLLAETTKDSEGIGRTLLLIEEPELFLHPQAIWRLRKAFKELSSEGYQVIIATHSPMMLSKNDIPQAILIRKNNNGTYRLKSIKESVEEKIEDHGSQADLLFDLGNSSHILFSEKILLMEGKTEKYTIPLVHESVTESTQNASQIAFIPLRGSSDIRKSKEILEEMKFNVKSVVDLDFCFQRAIKDGFLDENDEDIVACKELFQEFKEELEIKLSDAGLPEKNADNGTTAEEAYQKLAKEERIKPHISNLHDKLIKENIWVWKTGAVEIPLGIEAKNEKALNRFISIINQSDKCLDRVSEPATIQAFVEWLDS